MRCDHHIHMVLDGMDWKAAIRRHEAGPDVAYIRTILARYQKQGFTYLRDGGDRWGVGAAARALAGEYGIVYRTPLAPLCMAGHYGSFIGQTYTNLKEYAALVGQIRQQGGDFIKIMISGLMVSVLGIKLRALSMENGQISLTATMPQSKTFTHLGAFFKISLRARTARTSHPAEILILTISKNSSVIAILLPSGFGQSFAAPHPDPDRTYPGAW